MFHLERGSAGLFQSSGKPWKAPHWVRMMVLLFRVQRMDGWKLLASSTLELAAPVFRHDSSM